MAHPISGTGLGNGQGPGNLLQHRRRDPHGPRGRSLPLRKLVRLPCRRLGLQCSEFGDLAVGDGFQKHSYPFGIMVNATGRRFVDEGADFRNYTYAKYGRVILEQPDQFAWQVFDQKVTHLLRDEYRIRRVSKVTGQTLADLADKMEGVDKQGFLDEIQHYNNAVQRA